jgi:transposase
MKKNLIFIFDNARIHTTEEMRTFFSHRGLQAVTLPQYSPELNPIEKAFGIIKTKLTRSNLINRSFSRLVIQFFAEADERMLHSMLQKEVS